MQRIKVFLSIAAGLIFGLIPFPALGQHAHAGGESRFSLGLGAQAIGLLTHVTPGEAGRDLTEGYLTQPNLFLHANAWGNTLRFMGTMNLEGWTLQRGELNAGTWGEGYVDRRHPHTYLHEAMASLEHDFGPASASLSAGKGFAPFGTDDPMARPFVKFPANHHLTQILERLTLIGAVRAGPAILEAAVFNGNEPIDTKDLGKLDRFGDSWSARLSVVPTEGAELQVSHALVESPEQFHGGGLDQRKWSVSARYERGSVYALAEFARTAELRLGKEQLAMPSVLLEATWRKDDWRFAVRGERTTRVEEERANSIFRSPWPHAGARVLGMTRWHLLSAGASRELAVAGVRMEPLLEISHQRPKPLEQPSLFDPESLYGSDRLWSFSFGLRVDAGVRHMRMGRYGIAQNESGSPGTAATR